MKFSDYFRCSAFKTGNHFRLFVLPKAESEMGMIGKQMEGMFHDLVRKFLPYIDIQPVSTSIPTTSNNTATLSITNTITDTASSTHTDSSDQSLAPPKPKIKKTLSVEEDNSEMPSKEDTSNGSLSKEVGCYFYCLSFFGCYS